MTAPSQAPSPPGGRSPSLFGRVAGDILLITGAAGSAQVLALAAAPLITRLYNPEAFGQFALFNAAVATLYPLAALRYDLALPLPADEESALDLLALCIVLIMGSSIAVAGLIMCAAPLLSGWTGFTGAELMLLPIGILAFSLNGTATNLLSRYSAFSHLAYMRFATTGGMIVGQVALGWLMGPDIRGLIFGSIAGWIFGVVIGAPRLRPVLARCLGSVRPVRIQRVAAEYRSFAIITAPSNVVNAVGSQLPNIAFTALYGLAIGGQYALAQRVLTQPMAFVGQACNQVFWGNAARLFVEEPARLWPLFLRLNIVLIVVMLPGLVVTWYGREIFTLVFGPAWGEAGDFAGVLILAGFIALAAQGTTSLHVYRLNHWMSLWEILNLILIASVLAAAAGADLSPAGCVAALSAALAVSNATLFGLNAVAVRRAARRRAVSSPYGLANVDAKAPR